jgi:hypothetical protein
VQRPRVGGDDAARAREERRERREVGRHEGGRGHAGGGGHGLDERLLARGRGEHDGRAGLAHDPGRERREAVGGPPLERTEAARARVQHDEPAPLEAASGQRAGDPGRGVAVRRDGRDAAARERQRRARDHREHAQRAFDAVAHGAGDGDAPVDEEPVPLARFARREAHAHGRARRRGPQARLQVALVTTAS